MRGRWLAVTAAREAARELCKQRATTLIRLLSICSSAATRNSYASARAARSKTSQLVASVTTSCTHSMRRSQWPPGTAGGNPGEGGIGGGGVGDGGAGGDGGVGEADGGGDGSQKRSSPVAPHLAPFHLHSL